MYWGSLTFYFTSVQTANQYKGLLAVCEEDIDQKKYLSCFRLWLAQVAVSLFQDVLSA